MKTVCKALASISISHDHYHLDSFVSSNADIDTIFLHRKCCLPIIAIRSFLASKLTDCFLDFCTFFLISTMHPHAQRVIHSTQFKLNIIAVSRTKCKHIIQRQQLQFVPIAWACVCSQKKMSIQSQFPFTQCAKLQSNYMHSLIGWMLRARNFISSLSSYHFGLSLILFLSFIFLSSFLLLLLPPFSVPFTHAFTRTNFSS